MRTKLSRALLATLVCVASLVAAASPAAAVAPTFDQPAPERLYTVVNTAIPFTGSDPISGDERALVVNVTDLDCAPGEGNGWDRTGCARVQLSVAHGTLGLQVVPGNAGPFYGLSNGVIVESEPGLTLNINGTKDQLNAALATLVYTPANGYVYDGSNVRTCRCWSSTDRRQTTSRTLWRSGSRKPTTSRP